MHPTDLREAAAYIESIPKFTEKNRPEVTRRYLELLARGPLPFRIIHVAGTNGKGSVCAYLASIFREAGIRTGLFISPHLSDIRERISLDGDLIPEDAFAASFARVLALAGTEDLPHPAYFEFLFLMAMDWFLSVKPEYLILETGLGGRLDATNTAEGKVMTILTRIGLDHTQYLGTSLSSIAGEKAGILREGVPAVVLAEPAEALMVFEEKTAALHAPLYVLGPESYGDSHPAEGGIDFSFHDLYHTDSGKERTLRALLGTRALYQRENAALSAMAALLLGEEDLRIDSGRISAGLEKAFWPGRMEEIRPGVFLDGAHNGDGIRAFLSSAAGIHPGPGGRRILLFSVVGDKDYEDMVLRLMASGLFDVFAAAPMAGSRALPGPVLARTLEGALAKSGAGCRLMIYDDPETAFTGVLSMKEDRDLVFAAGSLYLIGALRDLAGRA